MADNEDEKGELSGVESSLVNLYITEDQTWGIDDMLSRFKAWLLR